MYSGAEVDGKITGLEEKVRGWNWLAQGVGIEGCWGLLGWDSGVGLMDVGAGEPPDPYQVLASRRAPPWTE